MPSAELNRRNTGKRVRVSRTWAREDHLHLKRTVDALRVGLESDKIADDGADAYSGIRRVFPTIGRRYSSMKGCAERS